MKTRQVDLLNIGLIFMSAFLAYLFPLELFILSLAILGPLHYLTEINWLDKKNYFTNLPQGRWLLIGLISSILIVLPKLYFYFDPDPDSGMAIFLSAFNNWTNGIIFLTLVMAAAFILINNPVYQRLVIMIGAGLALLLHTHETYITWVGLFIPTVIHVYIFTLLFMLFGARKSGSKTGYLAILSAIAIPLAIILIDLPADTYLFSDGMKSIYLDNNFHVPPVKFAEFIGISEGNTFYFYENMEIKLMMFFSFIYLYHYLNWFSKTSLIKWHKQLDIKTTIAILLIWTILLSLFYIDFRLGFTVGLFFSMLHVLLEFPLNVLSIKGLFSRQ